MINPQPTPAQLPPSTEGFTFYNLSGSPVGVHNLEVWNGTNRVYGPVNIGPVGPGQSALHVISPPVNGNKVTCDVNTPTGRIRYASNPVTGGQLISHSSYGVYDAHDGSGVIGWGADFLNDGSGDRL